MKKVVALTIVCGGLSGVFAQSYIGFSATNGDINGKKQSGGTMDIGFGSKAQVGKFGHQGGFEFDYINSNMSSETGNTVFIKYQPNYGFSESLRVFANVGYGYLQLAKTSSGGKTTSNYADGIGYGVGVSYDITKNIGLQVQYKSMPLESSTFHKAYDYTSVSGGVVFSY